MVLTLMRFFQRLSSFLLYEWLCTWLLFGAVRDGQRNLADADKKQPTKVQEMLEGVLASLEADKKREKLT